MTTDIVRAERLDAPEETRARATSSVARRVAVGLSLAALTAACAIVMMPPFDLWPLLFVAFVPMLVAQHRVLPPRLSGLAVGIGVGGLFAGQFYPGMAAQGLSWALKAWPLYLAAIVTIFASGSRGFHARTANRWLVVSGPVVWVAVEWLRCNGNELLGGTWGNPTYALYGQPWLLQPLSIFGIWGLELVVLLVNWAIAAVLVRGVRRDVFAVGAVAAGWVVLSLLLFRPSQAATLRVAAVQPGLGDDAQEFANDVAQTREAAAKGARLVVWRERGLAFDPRSEHTDELRALAADSGAHLAIGFGRRDERTNLATVLAPGGDFLGVYGKSHPGTFAGDYSDERGTYPVYDTPLGRLATIICYDLDFVDTAREMARRGAEIVAVPSNDNRGLAATHYTHLVFRAIENRLPMVKADRAWDSAIIDPWGRIIERTVTPEGARATLVADVARAERRPLQTSLGDWIGWLCAAGAAGFVVLSIRSRHISPRWGEVARSAGEGETA